MKIKMQSFFKEAVSAAQRAGQDLNTYFKSTSYEEDLDEVISFLYLIKPLQARNFEVIKNRKLRVGMKMKFIFSQSKVLLGASAAIGAEVGLVLGGPQGALTGATVGTASGILVITFGAGRVFVNRVSEARTLGGAFSPA
jgi:hypothetical protein